MQSGLFELDDLDLEIDDEAMKGLFARTTDNSKKPVKKAAAPKKEHILDGKRLHLVSIALRSAKLDYEQVLACIGKLNSIGLAPGSLEVRFSWTVRHFMRWDALLCGTVLVDLKRTGFVRFCPYQIGCFHPKLLWHGLDVLPSSHDCCCPFLADCVWRAAH